MHRDDLYRLGRLRGSSPWSPTVGTGIANANTTPVTIMTYMRGAGMILMIFGITHITTSRSAASGHTRRGRYTRCGNCELNTMITGESNSPHEDLQVDRMDSSNSDDGKTAELPR